MLGLVLAVPLACAPAAPSAAHDPMNSKREVGALFVTLAIDQPLEKALFLASARFSVVFHRRFGLEASFGNLIFARLTEVSVLRAVKLSGTPVLLKAGISHLHAGGGGDLGRWDARNGLHAGASLLSGDVDDGVRWRFEWAHRVMPGYRGFSTLGVGLVLQFHPLGS